MTKSIEKFNFNGKEIRTINKEGEPWFVAKDVADILEYSETEKMLRRLDDEEKLSSQFGGSGQSRDMIVINESGLYSAIIGSTKPEAKAFKKWITSEVLPQIRKTGGYIPIKEAESEEDLMARVYIIAMKTLEEKSLRIKQQDEKIALDAPKVEFYDEVMGSETLLSMDEVAKVLSLGYGHITLFKILREKGILCKDNTPMQYYLDKGWFKVIESKWTSPKDHSVNIRCTTKVTQQGVDGIRKVLKKTTSKT